MAFAITGSVAAQQLAQALVGSGITISNVTFTGNPIQAGTFSGGLSAGGVDQTGASGIGFDSGIILSSGMATATANPQTSTRNSTDFDGAGDAALTTQTGDQTYDAAVLEFDFNPGNSTQAFFNFVFGTDEYPSSPDYNDGFLILVNGANVAKIPGNSSAVQLSNFNLAVNKPYYKDASVNANPSGFPTQVINAEIESMSVVLQAVVTVLPNQTNHIKFAIADSGDASVDSFVFVQGGSLSTTPVSAVPSPALSLSPGSDSGTSGDLLTNVATPLITGTGIAGNTILVYDGATEIGTAVVALDGTWSTTVSALIDGPHDLTATQTDGDSNVSAASAVLGLAIDTVAPASPGSLVLAPASDGGTLGDGLTNDSTPTLTGTAETGSTVTITDSSSGSPVLVGTAVADGGGAWSFTPTNAIADGTYSFAATATDAAGNVSFLSDAMDLTIKTSVPAVPTNLALDFASDTGVPGDGITGDNTPTLTGSAEAGRTVTITDSSSGSPIVIGTALADGSGAWSLTTAALTDGTYSLTATATDAAGNVSAASVALPLTIDNTAPPILKGLALDTGSDTGVLGDSITGDNTPTFTGTAEPGSTVTLTDTVDDVPVVLGTALVDGNGAWSLTPEAVLADGIHSITTNSTDVAGNVSAVSDPLPLIIDTGVPAAPASLALDFASDSAIQGDGITNDNTPTITGTAEPGSTVTLTGILNGVPVGLGTSIADGSGNWSYTPPDAVPDGTYTVTAQATDAAGNVSPDSTAIAITVDTAVAAPVVTLAPASDSAVLGDGITKDNTPTITGTAEPGSTVTLTGILNGVPIGLGTAIADGSGNWSYTPPDAVPDGTYTVTAQATDAAGNVSLDSTAIAITVDTAVAAPVVTLAPASDSAVLGDGITNATMAVLTGTAEPGSTVTLTDSSTGSPVVIGTVLTDGSGSWSFTPTVAFAEGLHSITGVATDTAGNVSTPSPSFALTIDSVAPAAASGIMLDPLSDTGIAGDGITADATPTLTGTAEAGSLVTITDTIDGAPIVLGTALADGSGAWRFTPGDRLADGSHAFTATVTDAAGNLSSVTAALPLTIDTGAPEAPVITTLAPASDSGALGDGLTKDNTPTLTGTGEAGSTVIITDTSGGSPVVIGAALVDGSGAWSFTPEATLADGSHSMTATATDPAGNVSAVSASLGVTIDTAAPAVISDLALAPASDTGASGDGITGDNTPTFTGTAEPGSTVTLTDTVDDVPVVLGTALVDGNGAWSLTPEAVLADGIHSITTNSTDVAGNVSAVSDPLPLIIDTGVPAAPASLALDFASDSAIQGDGITNDNTPTITGTAEPGSTVTLTGILNGVPVGLGTSIADGSGNWSYTPPDAVPDGTYTVTAQATDAAGNVSPDSTAIAITVDTAVAAPVVTLAPASDSAVLGDGITKDNTPTITGTAEPGSTVTLTGILNGVPIGLGTAIADGSGNWSYTPPDAVPDGTYTVTAQATDAAGNVSLDSTAIAITVDTAVAAPVVTLAPASDSAVLGDGITNATMAVLTGTAEPGSTVTLTDSSTGSPVVIGTVLTDGSGSWSFTPTVAFAEGLHSITGVATDTAGNVSTPSPSFALTIDSVAPAAASGIMLDPLSDTGIAGDGITADATPTLTGTAEAGSLVTITDTIDDAPIVLGTALADGSGAWRFTPGDRLADGSHAFTATVTDAAGNLSSVTAALPLTIDTGAPEAPVITTLAPASDSGALGDGLTKDNTPTLTGTGEAGSTVIITDTSGGSPVVIGAALVDGSGAWSFTPEATLADGSHSMTATATDPAGNVSAVSASLGVTIDTAAPAVISDLALAPASDTGASGDGITGDNTPTFTGTAEPGSTVTLTDTVDDVPVVLGTALVDGNGAWSLTTAALVDSAYSLNATATDAAGNVSGTSSTLALTINTTVPETTSSPNLSPRSDSAMAGDSITNVAAPIITGTGTAGDIVALFDGVTQVGSARVAEDGTWSLSTTALTDGLHRLTAIQTNTAGNASPASTALAITIDTVVPGVPTLVSVNVQSSSAQPVVSGAGSAGDMVTVYSGNTAVGAAQVDANGGWTFSFAEDLPPGNYQLMATASDIAGNVSGASTSLGVVVATNGSYVISTKNPAGDTVGRAYDVTGLLTTVDVTSEDERLLQSVGNSSALRNIYDDAGTLIGTITQPSGSANDQPAFGTTAESLSATSTSSDAGSVITFLAETNAITTLGNDIVFAGGDSNTIFAVGASTLVVAGYGKLVFIASDGLSRVTGGTGSTIAFGGSGGGELRGGSAGNNVLVSNGGTTTLIGGGAGDVLVGGGGKTTIVMQAGSTAFGGSGETTMFGAANSVLVGGSGHNIMVAGAGDEALWAGAGTSELWGGTGNNVLGGGSGQATMVGGSGNNLFIGGSGQSKAYGGTGNETYFTGSGHMDIVEGKGADKVVFETGSASVIGGDGSDLYIFSNGFSGGVDVIAGFTVGSDHIQLFGYDLNSVQIQTGGGNTTMNLSDGTHITLLNVTQSNAAVLF